MLMGPGREIDAARDINSWTLLCCYQKSIALTARSLVLSRRGEIGGSVRGGSNVAAEIMRPNLVVRRLMAAADLVVCVGDRGAGVLDVVSDGRVKTPSTQRA